MAGVDIRESARGSVMSSVPENGNYRRGNVMNSVHVFTSIFALSAVWLPGCAVDPSQGSAREQPQASAGEAARPAGSPVRTGPHCFLSPANEMSCFATFREAMAAGSGGRIVDAPNDVKAALADPSFNARVDALAAMPRTQIVVAILYEDQDLSGSSFAIWKGTGCDGNINTMDHNVASLSPFGWSDTVTSLHSYSNCHTVLYENDNWTGARTGKIGITNYVGDAMDDRANSVEFY
jgi:hypothetical protein